MQPMFHHVWCVQIYMYGYKKDILYVHQCILPLPWLEHSPLHLWTQLVFQKPSWWSWQWSGHSNQTAPLSLCHSVQSKVHQWMLQTWTEKNAPHVNQWLKFHIVNIMYTLKLMELFIGTIGTLLNIDNCGLLKLSASIV